ncbi:MAG: GWxTD domain-containing protein [Bacteroidia bacterium]|nr:GWxTD domain-containing protein [Bacteroidia bacterium]
MNRFAIVVGILFSVCAVSCRSSQKISDINFSGLYSVSGLQPEISVYQEADSAASLTIAINRKELLYKKDDYGSFLAHFRIHIRSFPALKSTTLIDSVSLEMNDADPENQKPVFCSLKLKTLTHTVFYCLISVTDINRQQQFRTWQKVDKTNRQSRVYFRLTDENGNDKTNPYLRTDEQVKIVSKHEPSEIKVRCYHRNFPFALPPFAEKVPVQFNYAADSIYSIEYHPGMKLNFPAEGFYHLQFDTAVKAGLTIFRFNDDFPRITDADKMIESLRYITNNNEYSKLRSASDKKEAIDRFWIELSGSRERARTLIRKYYSRVQQANRLFTTHQEGWQTDRGMIYIVFGPPATVYIYQDSEEWGYGTYGYSGTLNFTFEKIYNPFSDNDFVLRRSPFYEQPFYRAVSRWREGVAEND